MTCDEFRDRVFDHLAGTLPERAAFEGHAVSCPACASLLRGIEDNERVLRRAGPPPVPGDLWPRIAAAIGAGKGMLRPPRWRRAAVVAAAAGLAAALVLVFASAPPRRGGLDIVVVEAGPALGPLVPRWGELEEAQALAGVPSRSRNEDWR